MPIGQRRRTTLLAARLSNIEIPPFAMRTQLRGLYNYYLRDVCRERGLTFVDDYAPFLDGGRGTDPRCYIEQGGREYHLDFRASETALVDLIWRFASSCSVN